MEFYDINQLSRDPNQNNLYDLFAKTFRPNTIYQFQTHIVQPDEEMRIDLICDRLYGDTKYVDFLLNFNEIDNPLNVKQDDVIKWCEISLIDEFKDQSAREEELTRTLLNSNKSTRKDPNRQAFIDEGFSLPPNFLETPQSSVNVVGNTLVLGI
jgi:hypothetical protein